MHMSKPAFEFQHQKQPNTLDLYLEKISKMEERTLIKYNSRWKSLIFSKFTKNEKDLAARIDNLITNVLDAAKSSDIKPSTFRQYKASICFGLASTLILLKNNKIEEDELEAGISYQFLSNMYKKIVHESIETNSAIENNIPERTSAMKKKSFPEAFFIYLNQFPDQSLGRKNTRFDLMLKFVNANILIGLRPIEWLNVRICSDIKEKNIVLFVENAKNSFGRANGDVRELILSSLSSEEVFKILDFYVSFQNRLTDVVKNFKSKHSEFQKNNDFTEIKDADPLNYILNDFEPTKLKIPLSEILDKNSVPQKGIASIILDSIQNEMQAIYNIYLDNQPDVDFKKITLYSTRHQCIANAKASKTNVYEIAAFFGHSSVETSTRHYGKAWSGWSNFDFKPSLESIKNVSNSLSYLEQQYGYQPEPEIALTNTKNDFSLGLR